jgi:hypothetical protein
MAGKCHVAHHSARLVSLIASRLRTRSEIIFWMHIAPGEIASLVRTE